MEAIGSNRVHSFDHVAINDKVISCNMKAVPLDDGDLDIAVFSLSLMGRNWPDYIVEAKRCLAKNGYLLIAETTKSFKSRLSSCCTAIHRRHYSLLTWVLFFVCKPDYKTQNVRRYKGNKNGVN